MSLRISSQLWVDVSADDAEQKEKKPELTRLRSTRTSCPQEARVNIVPYQARRTRAKRVQPVLAEQEPNAYKAQPIQKVGIIQTAIPDEQQTMASYSFQLQEESNSNPRPTWGGTWCAVNNQYVMNPLLQRKICWGHEYGSCESKSFSSTYCHGNPDQILISEREVNLMLSSSQLLPGNTRHFPRASLIAAR
jgi:hypothetical protein